MNNNEQNGFSYTYSAKDQAEIIRIREKYKEDSKEEDELTLLRRLDASVTGTAQTVALTLGIIGVLVLGFGMSLCMTELGDILGIYGNMTMIVGIAVGVLGGILASLAYPIYNAIVKAKRKKLAPEIIRLADSLIK